MSDVTILVGAQWGDEGKGKWIDILSERADVVARYQGGNNAGHTVYIEGQKRILHQLPSGVFHPRMKSALAAGVVVNPVQLVQEIVSAQASVSLTPERLWLSPRCHVITPWHIRLDERREAAASHPIGTTKRGIGPTYSEKANRSGIRLGHFVDHSLRQAWINDMSSHNPEFAAFWKEDPKRGDALASAADALRPFVTDAEFRLRGEVSRGSRVLLEGAQGTMLDLDHGTYPYVTSSSTTTGGACASLGLSPKAVTMIYGVAKAYVTRVGAGPMPTELSDAAGEHLARVGAEFGATTGRRRRCGWLDAVALRYAASINGFDGLILNKIDVLTGLDEVKVCTAYKHPRLGTITELPWDQALLAECTPVYESFEGWKTDLHSGGELTDLPKQAQRYIAAVQSITGVPIIWIGTGVGRNDSIAVGH